MDNLRNKKVLLGVLIGLIVIVFGAIVIQQGVPLYKAFDGDVSEAFAYLKPCLSSNAGWECVAPTENIGSLSVDPTNHNLWGDSIITLNYFSMSEKTGLFAYPTVIPAPPETSVVMDICPSNKLWIAMLYLEENGAIEYLVPYGMDTAQWGPDSREIASLPQGNNWRCITSRSGNLIAWNSLLNWLGVLTDHTWEPITLEFNDYINMLNEDKDGNLWVLTYSGEVYAYDYQTTLWTLIAKLDDFHSDPSNSFEIEGGDIWILNRESVLYHLRLDDENHIFEKKYQFNNSFNRGFFEDSQGVLWVVWGNPSAVWTYSSEGAWEIEMPQGVEYIRSAAFDYELQRLYIATDQGIYYRTVGNIPTR